jgi:hypothetical protein
MDGLAFEVLVGANNTAAYQKQIYKHLCAFRNR